jgi:hypothetical protein
MVADLALRETAFRSAKWQPSSLTELAVWSVAGASNLRAA